MTRRANIILAAAVGLLLTSFVTVAWAVPLAECQDCTRESMIGFGCGIEGVTGISWVDRIYNKLAGGRTYRWVGHPIYARQCATCLGKRKVTLVQKWTRPSSGDADTPAGGALR